MTPNPKKRPKLPKIPAKMGRPTKYLPEMCDAVVALMSEGASKIEVAHEIGISGETLNEWSKDNPDFSAAIKAGEAASHAWWLSKGRKNLENKDFSATLWYMNMKNRHGWRDKTELTGNGPDGALNIMVTYAASNSDTPPKA